MSTKSQLFQFNGRLYEQTDEVAMGSSLGPLLANLFMSSLEEKLELEGKLPDYYRRYVDDTLTIMPNIMIATDFLNTLNHAPEIISLVFTCPWKSKKMACSRFLAPSSLTVQPKSRLKFMLSLLILVYSSTTRVTLKTGTNGAYKQLWSIARTVCPRHGFIFWRSVSV